MAWVWGVKVDDKIEHSAFVRLVNERMLKLSGSLSPTSGDYLPLSPTGTQTVSGSVAGDKLVWFKNTSATGYGVRFQSGADANYAIKVSNAAGSADVFTVRGMPLAVLGDVGSTLDGVLAGDNAGTYLSIEGTATNENAGVILTSGDYKLTSMLYMTGGDRGMRLSWNYREPYQDGGSQMHSDANYPVIQCGWETTGDWSINYTRKYATAAGTYDTSGKTLKIFGGGYNPGVGPYDARGRYTSFVVGNNKRGFDFQVANQSNVNDYVQRLVIEPSHETDGTTAIDNAIKIWVGGALKTVELGAADSGGAGYKMLRVTN